MRAPRQPAAKTKADRKSTLSPTRITTYLECAVKYRYIYLDKIGRYYLRAKPYYSFGSTLHQVLQEFHEQGAESSVEAMSATLEQTWIKAGYQTEAQEQAHREIGEQIVASYHAAHQERVQAQTETIATEKTITCDLGYFKLSGRVDRIDRHPDGRLEIIDYKSGRWETTPEEVAGDLAINCYQLILSHLYPDTPIFATIYCLRSGIQASAELAGEARAEFARDLIELGKEILERDYQTVRPIRLPVCEGCDFLPRCALFWRQQNRDEAEDSPMSENGI